MKNQGRIVITMVAALVVIVLDGIRTVAAPVPAAPAPESSASAAGASASRGGGAKAVSSRSEPRPDLNPALLYLHAFSLSPSLPESKRAGFLSEPPTLETSQGQEVSARFDAMFKLLRQAAQLKAPCDWGTDPADGPSALGPNTVQIRKCYQATQARAHFALASGRDQDAAEDLVALLALGRNCGRDGALVPTMVGLSVERAVTQFLADNFSRFSPTSLRWLQARIDEVPPRWSVRQAMAAEQAFYLDWFIDRLEQIRSMHASDASRAMEVARAMLSEVLAEKVKDLDRMIDDAHGSVSGLVEYFRQVEPLYRKAERLAGASPESLEAETAAFQPLVDRHSNPIARVAMPNVGKARRTELETIASTAMLRAALALQLDGEAAFRKIQDPFGSGPFLRRNPLGEKNGAGFELESKASEAGLSATLKLR